MRSRIIAIREPKDEPPLGVGTVASRGSGGSGGAGGMIADGSGLLVIGSAVVWGIDWGGSAEGMTSGVSSKVFSGVGVGSIGGVISGFIGVGSAGGALIGALSDGVGNWPRSSLGIDLVWQKCFGVSTLNTRHPRDLSAVAECGDLYK